MLFNHKLKYEKSIKQRFIFAYLMISYVILGKNISYLMKSNDKLVTFFAMPIGLIVAFRRKKQYENHLVK